MPVPHSVQATNSRIPTPTEIRNLPRVWMAPPFHAEAVVRAEASVFVSVADHHPQESLTTRPNRPRVTYYTA
jgi:hypothetical protein